MCQHENITINTLESLTQHYDGANDRWGDYVDTPMPEYILSAFCSDCETDVAALYADQLGIKAAPPEVLALFPPS